MKTQKTEIMLGRRGLAGTIKASGGFKPKSVGFQIVVLVLVLILGSVGCGSKKTANFEDAESTQLLPGLGLGSLGGSLAECNRLYSPDYAIDVQLATYYDTNTGDIDFSKINTHITSLPEAIASSSSYFIQVFRWAEDTSGGSVVNSEPVPMIFVDRLTGLWVNKGKPEKVISKQVMLNMISLAKNPNATPSTFFEHFLIIMTDVNFNYDALSFALYSGVGQSAAATFDVLIPPFSANPNEYMAEHASEFLHQLHPNYAIRDTGGSDESYLATTQSFCSSFF